MIYHSKKAEFEKAGDFMQQCPNCDYIYDESEYSKCPKCYPKQDDYSEKYFIVYDRSERCAKEITEEEYLSNKDYWNKQ